MNIRYLLLVILLSCLPFISIFSTADLPHTSDGEVQIPRMAAFYKAVSDGHVPVRWAGDLNYGYGMPLFTFIYHTPFYISTVLIFLGFSLVLTFKFVLLISFILSGIFMFLFTKEFFQDEKKALFVSLLYQFAPYHLIDILTRGAIGTIYVYAFFPLILLGLRKHNIALTAIATALMILSHNSMALIFFGVTCLFSLLFTKKKIQSFFALGLGLGLSSFYWMPAVFEHKYTYGDLFMKDLYKVNFPKIENFFIPNFLNNPSLRVSEVAVHWGLVHTIAPVAAVILWKRMKKDAKKMILLNFALLGICVFFMNPVSAPLWERISLLRQFQFPWRLLSVVVFATSLLGAVLCDARWMKKRYIYTLSIIVILASTVFYWQPTQGYDRNIDEEKYWNYPLNTTYFGETDVIWSAGPAYSYPKSRIEVIEGDATISNFYKKTQIQTFTVESETPAKLVSHTQYFPGWRVYINGRKVPIEFQDQNWRGLITFEISKGTHNVRIQFEETPLRLLANVITVSSFMVLAAIKFKKI
jgi:hypothetical protein